MNGKAGAVSTIIAVCLALEAIMRDQVEQLNKIRVAAGIKMKKPEELVCEFFLASISTASKKGWLFFRRLGKNWKVQDYM